jgi:hypothetical protein
MHAGHRVPSPENGMKSSILLAALAIAAAATTVGCEKRGQGPNPPTPTTQQELAAVVAQTPATDPSLPDASVALAAADAASAAAS